MERNDIFTFGLNKGLTLQEVFQGTELVNRNLIMNFLSFHSAENYVPKSHVLQLCDFVITENEILVVPQIFDEEKKSSIENQIFVGDISKNIESYFNCFFDPNWYGAQTDKIQSIMEFNKKNGPFVIGANPEYVKWCLFKEKIKIDDSCKKYLENIQISRLKGIKVEHTGLNKYSYDLIIEKNYYNTLS